MWVCSSRKPSQPEAAAPVPAPTATKTQVAETKPTLLNVQEADAESKEQPAQQESVPVAMAEVKEEAGQPDAAPVAATTPKATGACPASPAGAEEDQLVEGSAVAAPAEEAKARAEGDDAQLASPDAAAPKDGEVGHAELAKTGGETSMEAPQQQDAAEPADVQQQEGSCEAVIQKRHKISCCGE